MSMPLIRAFFQQGTSLTISDAQQFDASIATNVRNSSSPAAALSLA
jgi:hypothetical protein